MKSIGLIGVLAFSLTATYASADGHADPYATHHELGLQQGFPPPPDQLVTKDNALITFPYIRYSFQNMRAFYPTIDIPPSSKPRTLDVVPDGGIERLSFINPEGEAVDMAGFLEQTWADSFVVIHDDKIVFERYLNGMHADQPHQMMSVTKSFAGLFGLMAAEAGLVSEDTLIAEVIPELDVSTAFGDATFGQVLDMTNSMDFSEDYADPASGIQQYAQVMGFLPRDPALDLPGSIYDYLPTVQIDAAHPHGEIFHYQTPKTDVVNWVTNRVTGQSFFDQLSELMEAIGAKGETYVLLDQNGTLFAGGGLNATPHNLAKFAAMMLNDGMVDGQVVVPEPVIEKLEAGANRDAFARGPNAADIPNGENGDGSYRAQWWVRHTPGREAFTALGIHGQWIYIDRAHDVAVIRHASQPVSTSNEIDGAVYHAIDTITDYLTGE